MRADGVLGDEQPLCDLVRAVVLVEQEEDLDLARREGGGNPVRHARAPAARAHLVEEPAGNRPGEGRLAVHDSGEEIGDPVGRLGLEQVPGRATANRGEQVLLGTGRGENDDLAARRSLAEPR